MIPWAIIEIELLEIRNIPSGFSTFPLFVNARVGGRAIGRSRVIPSGATTFDLRAEPQSWRHRVAVQSRPIHVSAVIHEERGDQHNTDRARMAGNIVWPYPASGQMTFGSGPELVCNVVTRIVPGSNAAQVARSTGGAPAPAVVGVPATQPSVLVAELTNVRGLYRPGFVPVGIARPRHSEHSPGYASDDDLGRIFLNRDLADNYARDTQLIELTARIHAQRGSIPAAAKVRWVVRDPDDPSDGSARVHAQWAPYLDSHEYGGSGPTGARDRDNEGRPDRTPRWEQAVGFPLAIDSPTEARTDIVAGVSKVLIHCPNVAGDNLIVRAEIVGAGSAEVFEAESGIMTMWNRLEVEYVRLTRSTPQPGALPLPVAQVPPLLEPMYAELNFALERALPVATQFMAASSAALDASTATFVTTNFSHAANPGWFCLISAMEPHPLPTQRGRVIFNGHVTLQQDANGPYFDIPGSNFTDPVSHTPTPPDYVTVSWPGQHVSFSVMSAVPISGANRTRIRIWGHDVQPDFTAGDGSIDHAYASTIMFYPRVRDQGGTFTPPGYGAPPSVHVEVRTEGAFYTSGISPSLTVGGVEYFAGRTVIFTHHSAYFDAAHGVAWPTFNAEIVQTIAHELVHAFGMPHKCGYFDVENPRAHTCAMNYSPNWMIDASRNPVAGTSGRVGNAFCGRHIKEVRRVHLEDNGGLHSLGW